MTPQAMQPDIGYYPDLYNYEARSNMRMQHLDLDYSLPDGFPRKLISSASWTPSLAEAPERWLFHLTQAQIGELKEAVRKFQDTGLPTSHVCQDTFTLPTYGAVLRTHSKEVHDGIGFCVMRGFPVEALNAEEQVILFLGISSYIGNHRARQDDAGAAISHVINLTQVHEGYIGNPAFTAGPQAMHTDPGPIIGMFCLSTAEIGGESVLASTSTVYNELVKTKPYLVRTLSEDWILDGFGGDPPYTQRPLMFLTPSSGDTLGPDAKIVVQFVRRALTGFGKVPRTKTIPPITEAQAEALDALHFVGRANAIRIQFEKGDLQFLNNLNVLHGRDDFQDGPRHKRHLLRVWLKDEEYGWSMPDALTNTKQWKRLWALDMKGQLCPTIPAVKSEKLTS